MGPTNFQAQFSGSGYQMYAADSIRVWNGWFNIDYARLNRLTAPGQDSGIESVLQKLKARRR